MTKQEFTELTGINPTEEEFDKIHELYMATGAEMDKNSFCTAYKNCKDMTLVNALYRRLAFSINRLKKERDSMKEERDKVQDSLDRLSEKATDASADILKVAEKTLDENHAEFLNGIARSLTGQFNVCMTKLERGYTMDEKEREFFFCEIASLKGRYEDLQRERENE